MLKQYFLLNSFMKLDPDGFGYVVYEPISGFVDMRKQTVPQRIQLIKTQIYS